MTDSISLLTKCRAICQAIVIGIALLLTTAQAPAPKSPAIPDTPAGHMLSMWLKAFDSGDPTIITKFYEQHMPTPLVAGAVGFNRLTGGVDLIAVKTIDPLRILFIAKDRATPNQGVGLITLSDSKSTKAETMTLRAVPKGTKLLNLDVDSSTRARVIDSTIAALNAAYVDPVAARRMEADLRARQKRGEFDNIRDGAKFAQSLMDALLAVSHDKHLSVEFLPARLPAPVPPSPEDTASLKAHMRASHCGFQPAQHLAGNVGLLKIEGFPEVEFCAEAASDALNSLGAVNAIIFDLRDNHGGSPAMVNYIASYLFAHRTHITDVWTRKTGATDEFWTLENLPGRHYTKQPVFILTSSRTFSGGEDFSYSLQALRRAVIVGETTGGGAHPVSGQPVGDGFVVMVPFAKTINPVTRTNWEAVGVTPNVKVAASKALETALTLAPQREK